jgi:BioD-like phosphotransacetylase family protein
LANEREVPVVLAGQNTMVTATICEKMLYRTWIRPGPALDYAMDYVRYNIDIDRILEKSGDL